MKSLCFKTNNPQIIDFLLKSFENINLENTYVSIKKFNHFNNIIIHYLGEKTTLFLTLISNIITNAIINFYENNLILDNINLNYFYFNSYEKNKILKNTLFLISDKKVYNKRYDYINNAVFKHTSNNHSLYIQGFINFNLSDYINFLNNQIENAVNKFLIDKEYIEFVNILKLYIKSETQNSKTDHLHLIYKSKNSIIIDDDKNIISCNDNMKKAKYISDISFSSNDFALNTLLNLIPKKITIHLVNSYEDEFINTLKLIFQDRIKICDDCDICNFYKCKETNKL